MTSSTSPCPALQGHWALQPSLARPLSDEARGDSQGGPSGGVENKAIHFPCREDFPCLAFRPISTFGRLCLWTVLGDLRCHFGEKTALQSTTPPL